MTQAITKSADGSSSDDNRLRRLNDLWDREGASVPKLRIADWYANLSPEKKR